MKAVILAGGEGTRLRPLTLATPKPIVPIVDRPFLRFQLDLLARAGVREVIFSLAYRPERIQAVFGDGRSLGLRIHYALEETPLGTGGAVRNALPLLDERTIVLNGDVLVDLDFAPIIERHAAERASASILLTPVSNPTAYGLVQTDAAGRVRSFVEKPSPEQITTDTINAGIYVLETRVLDLMPAGVNHSIERAFFPTLLARGDRVLGPVHRGYWVDIGTPEKYLQVHRDILNHRFPVRLEGDRRGGALVHPTATVASSARLEGACYIGAGCQVADGARVGPDAALCSDVRVAERASVSDSVLWPGASVGPDGTVQSSLVGGGVTLGRAAFVRNAILGEGSIISDFSRAF